MNSQEQQLLEDFLNRLAAAPPTPRDPQASALIQQRLAGLPDPGYVLVQRAILLEQALKAAQQKISQLQQAYGDPAEGSSFLGGAAAGAYGAPPPPPPPGYEPARPSWRDRFFGGGAPAAPVAQPSILGSVATTAAGVAGGMFLAEGIESLFSGHHGGGFLGGGGYGDSTVVENVTNVYDTNNYDNSTQNFGNDNDNDNDFADNSDFDNSDFNGGDWS